MLESSVKSSLHVIGGHSIGIAFSKLCAQEPRRLIDNTVKPVLNGHPWGMAN